MSDMIDVGMADGRNGGELDSYALFTRGDEYTCGFVWGYTDKMVGFAKADVFWSLLGENAKEVNAPLSVLLTLVPAEHAADVKNAYNDSDFDFDND